jgi:predicted nucleic acid-binding Zn ribbon protein
MPNYICKYCGKTFFSYTKGRKYCSTGCAKLAKWKTDYPYPISNKEFKEKYSLFYNDMKRILWRRLSRFELQEEVWQDMCIALWILLLRQKAKGLKLDKLNPLYVKNMLANIVKKSYYSDRMNIQRLTEHISDVLYLSTPTKHSEDITIADTLPDNYISTDKYLDIKTLTTKLFVEASQKEEVQLAIIQAEEKCNKTHSFKDIAKEYGFDFSSKQFSERARAGKVYFYSKYKDEIQEVLDTSEEECSFKLNKEYHTPQFCKVCGRVFIPLRANHTETCSTECHVILTNAQRNHKARVEQEKKLLDSIRNLQKERRKLREEVNNKKQQIQYYQAKEEKLKKLG